MRRFHRAAPLAVLALAAWPAAAWAAQPGVAVTQINSVGKTNSGTGSSAAPPINARVVTVDTGGSINTTGIGTGFQAQGLYVSVLYENGSQATGPKACLPAGKVNFGDRVIGAWVPDGSTTRVLAPVTEVGQAYTGSAGSGSGGQLVGNWDQGTISVRMVNLIKPPTLYANLQACGRVQTAPTATAAAAALWNGPLSAVDGLASGVAQAPTVADIAKMTDPIAPTLPIGGTAAQLPTSPGTGSGTGTTKTTTVTAPGTTKTTTAPTVTVTKTVSTPAATVTTPGVTVTAPAVTVTAPAVTVTVPGVTVPGLARRG